MSVPLTLRVDEQTKIKLDKLSEAVHRSRSYLVYEALQHYIEINEWQIQEIQEGLRSIEEEEKTPHDEVKKYWEARLGCPLV